ncbi:hypothetical protein JCM17846_00280 [Iodidimonas nitroreducens]|uniref:Tetratricopeptide repeat-like domain-containing protein n=1 Tax=Iodidimonas nitroreducens TaxID=1236968 RepID=A0A5A7N5Q6_9PROT|nr:hypothetical protein [Iodidimonas nitroreducens]GAK34908.1 hypothetical protein AQ1_02817 [alpha proteobacterium Q-1]GER02346.1 hypothetical protein JCM17846_00280 [Iodidimonas nitroreducens]
MRIFPRRGRRVFAWSRRALIGLILLIGAFGSGGVAAFDPALPDDAGLADDSASPSHFLPDDLLAAYDAGQWDAVIARGTAMQSAGGFVMASRAFLASVMYDDQPDQQKQAAQQAVDWADRALALDADAIEILLQAAASYGVRAQINRSLSDAMASKRFLEKAYEIDPDDPRVLASFGFWHGRVILGAGSFLGGLFFGADRDQAIDLFQRSLEQDPDNLLIHAGFGRLLLRFGKARLRPLAVDHLKQSLLYAATSVHEQRAQEDSRILLEADAAGATTGQLADLADQRAPFKQT